ncbi:MAG TPA: sulfatase/phosphatase domain-containing protein [Caldilineaceae bacterium]|nr:sulfatase/phosphatase domain-containing protein [Caldilineaceae bacterium]
MSANLVGVSPPTIPQPRQVSWRNRIWQARWCYLYMLPTLLLATFFHIAPGAINDTLFGTIDHLPTLLGLCGIAPSVPLHGQDFAPLMLGGAQPSVESLFLMDMVRMDESDIQNLGEWRGVRTPRYTYARQVTASSPRPWLLYDNEADPYQLTNLVDDPSCAQVRAALDAEVDAWQARVGDPGLPGADLMRQLGLVELWNERERLQHPHAPQLI